MNSQSSQSSTSNLGSFAGKFHVCRALLNFFSEFFFQTFASNTFFSAIIAARLWLTRKNMRTREGPGETFNFHDSVNIIEALLRAFHLSPDVSLRKKFLRKLNHSKNEKQSTI
jgi:hypothetical protein